MLSRFFSLARPCGREFNASLRFGARLLAIVLGWTCLAGAKEKWDDVSPADLAAKDSASAPGASMEILFSRHYLDGNDISTYLGNYVRAKIYTQKGVEDMKVLGIEARREYKVSQIQARVVRVDGSSVELTKSDFHETIIAKTGQFDIRRLAFAFPNVQPGDIVEYRWIEGIDSTLYSRMEFFCQEEEVPVREYEFELRGASRGCNVEWFHCPPEERKGNKIVFHNVPAFHPEPMMPTQYEYRGWIYISFPSRFFQQFFTKESAWPEIGDYWAEDFRLKSPARDAIKAQAAELTTGVTTPAEQLSRLCRFCQKEIRNIDWNEDAASMNARKKHADDNYTDQLPSETLKKKEGSGGEIQYLFAALARAKGFEVRLGLNADRRYMLNINTSRGWQFAGRRSVGVKLGDNWKFYEPDDPLVEPGMLRYEDEGAMVYICDEKKSWMAMMQTADAEATQVRRTAHLKLDSDGNLDGDVEIQMTGHTALDYRTDWRETSDEEITKQIRATVADRLGAAELSEIKWENLSEIDRPFVIRYKVHVPGYAEAIGSRLAFAPNFFTANSAALFTAETRHLPILFNHAMVQHDAIEIELPPDFKLDGASAPAPVNKPDDVINVQYRVSYKGKTRTLGYQRDYTLCRGGALDFSVDAYPALRLIDTHILKSDTHQLMLKPKAAAAAASAADAPGGAPTK